MKQRITKRIFVILGFVLFGLGAVGAVIPILPTTPFLLLAAACFARGSARFHEWFQNTRLYKRHLDSFVRERAMTLGTKVRICAIASALLLLGFFLMNNLPGRIVIVCVMLAKYYYFLFRIKTIRPDTAPAPEPQDAA